MTTKFYAVVSGRKPGIYSTWESTKEQINKFSGAIYKSFSNLEDAQNFITPSVMTPPPSPQLSRSNKISIYTDGSCKDGKCGYAVIIINGDEITSRHGKVPEIYKTNNCAELYAIYVALSLVKRDVVIHTDSEYSKNCLTVYIHDWMRHGWDGISNKDLILATYDLTKGRSVEFVHVKAHNGNKYNEACDKLAKESIGIS